MENNLFRLRPKAREFMSLDSWFEGPSESVTDYCELVEPRIDLKPMLTTVQHAMELYRDKPREESDAWLAPRFHATLRLQRSDAGDMQIWDFLSIMIPELREYIVWRYKKLDGSIDKKRVFSFRRHVLARLWWVSELTRNGKDYSHTETAFSDQELIIHLTDRNAFHNRPATLAFIEVLSNKNGNIAPRIEVRELANKFNHVLTTIVLDSVAPDIGPNLFAYSNWAGERIDDTLIIGKNLEGPDEPKVDENLIEEVKLILRELLEEIRNT